VTRRPYRTVALLAALSSALLLALVPAAGAKERGDRNHDRIPDRWERAHHLSLKVNQAARDQDRDGLRNRAEFLAGTDPRNDDSDDDGTEDGAEGAGRVASFAGGKLTIALFNGEQVSGLVNSNTEIKCESRDMPTAQATARSAEDEPGEDDGGDDNEGDGDNNQGDHNNQGDDDEQGQQAGCDASLLTANQVVQQAELKATAGGLVFREIELVR
jgi:hypothetical protein